MHVREYILATTSPQVESAGFSTKNSQFTPEGGFRQEHCK
jgi:hypothetical protein